MPNYSKLSCPECNSKTYSVEELKIQSYKNGKNNEQHKAVRIRCTLCGFAGTISFDKESFDLTKQTKSYRNYMLAPKHLRKFLAKQYGNKK